jgi:hypothetical protein
MKKKLLFTCVLSLIAFVPTFAEFSFISILRQHTRALSLSGERENESLNFHSLSNDGNLEKSPLWKHIRTYRTKRLDEKSELHLYYPETWMSFNSQIPFGGNDGPIWQGKGLNGRMSFGFWYDSENLDIVVYPTFWYAQNQDFDTIVTTSSSGYGDYWTVFDNLQRYGDSPYYEVNAGESDLRLRFNGFSFGISNESIVIGPGQYNNILLGTNAGGFPHLDFGTDGKTELGNIGFAEIKILWGMLKESDYFDKDPDNDRGFFSGLYTAFAPKLIPGFTIGFNHQYYKPFSEIDSWDAVRAIPFVDRSNSPTDLKDMMVSLTFSWIFPESGFEFYGEWARNDNFVDWKDLYSSPEHTHGFSLGVNQVLYRSIDKVTVLTFEMTTLSQERTYEVRAAGPWYRHGWAGWKQGFTYNGQLLGASIGPGSDSQILAFSVFIPDGYWGFTAQRIARDKDYYYAIFNLADNASVYSETVLGIQRAWFLEDFALFLSLKYDRLLNYNYEYRNNKFNLRFETGISIIL